MYYSKYVLVSVNFFFTVPCVRSCRAEELLNVMQCAALLTQSTASGVNTSGLISVFDIMTNVASTHIMTRTDERIN